jgi:hypothetical protein
MSTDYCPLKQVPACDLFDGRLEAFGVHEHVKPDETTKTRRCLTDGRNYLWVYIDDDGFVAVLTRYGANAPGKILNAVAEACETDIVSEYEPQFWGFDTQEDWDVSMEQMSRESEENFYIEILKYLRREPNDIQPGTIGMIHAEIAKRVIAESPDLLAENKRPDLIKTVEMIYDRDHAIVVTLTDQDRAFTRMVATHEDDLPQA